MRQASTSVTRGDEPNHYFCVEDREKVLSLIKYGDTASLGNDVGAPINVERDGND